MPLGPLQIMIVNFEHTNFTGEIEAEFVRLQDAGIIRVLDLIFVAKSEAGEVEVLKTGEVHTGTLTGALLGLDGPAEETVDADDADVWYAADAVAPGNAAAIAVLEHQWAIPLRTAILNAGGRDVTTEWVDEEQLTALGVALPSDTV
jgi:hypothetical protein